MESVLKDVNRCYSGDKTDSVYAWVYLVKNGQINMGNAGLKKFSSKLHLEPLIF